MRVNGALDANLSDATFHIELKLENMRTKPNGSCTISVSLKVSSFPIFSQLMKKGNKPPEAIEFGRTIRFSITSVRANTFCSI